MLSDENKPQLILEEEVQKLAGFEKEFQRLVAKVNELITEFNNSYALINELVSMHGEVTFELKYKQELLARIFEHMILEKQIITKEEYSETANLYAKQLKEEISNNAEKDGNLSS